MATILTTLFGDTCNFITLLLVTHEPPSRVFLGPEVELMIELHMCVFQNRT